MIAKPTRRITTKTDEELRDYLKSCVKDMPSHWTKEQQSAEMAQWAIENGFGDIPVLNLNGEPGGVSQRVFDVAVEEAFSFLKDEARRVLDEG